MAQLKIGRRKTSPAEREVLIRALRAERVLLEEILRDGMQLVHDKDETLEEIELCEQMLIKLGACPAVTVIPTLGEGELPTINSPIHMCVKVLHKEGDHLWF